MVNKQYMYGIIGKYDSKYMVKKSNILKNRSSIELLTK